MITLWRCASAVLWSLAYRPAAEPWRCAGCGKSYPDECNGACGAGTTSGRPT